MDDGFAEQLHNLQEQSLLTRKEADFRSYLVKTGVAEDIVKVLVGMEEAEEKPPDALGFVQANYGTRLLALVEGRPIDKINEVVEENETLKARVAGLESQFADTLGRVAKVETGKRKAAFESLIALHAAEPGETEEEEPPSSLDLGKMYAVLLSRFPAAEAAEAAETAEAAEATEAAEAAVAAEAMPWSAQFAEEPPTGAASISVLEQWYPACFAMDAEMKRPYEPALFDELVRRADPTPPAEGEEPPAPMEMATALQLHTIFWSLVAAAVPVAAAAPAEPTE